MLDVAFQPEFLSSNNRCVTVMKYGWDTSVSVDVSAAGSLDLNVSCCRNSRGLKSRIPSFICGTQYFLMPCIISFHVKYLSFAKLTERWPHTIMALRRSQCPCRWVWRRVTEVRPQTRSRNENPMAYSKDRMRITAWRGNESAV